ncbi:hypothetical protein EMCRGX_G001022 [Ephydatia muelleri]
MTDFSPTSSGMRVYKDTWPKCSGNTPAEIVECITTTNNKEPNTTTISSHTDMSRNFLSVWVHVLTQPMQLQTVVSGRVDPPHCCMLSLLSLHCTPGVQGCQSMLQNISYSYHH